ncbi:MAG: ABC transporter permease [Actinomycetales bacterium]|nr:ABC transporter permease [Actinomycetales bacterium]
MSNRILPRLLLILGGGLILLSFARTLSHASDLTSTGTMSAAFGLAVPIGLAGLGGLWSERAGVANIGLEGMMILGTFGAGWAGWQYGAWVGLLVAIIFGAIGGLVFGLATVTFGVDQIVAGTAINILGLGLTQFLAKLLFSTAPGGGATQSPPIFGNLPDFSIAAISDPLSALQERNIFLISDLSGIISGLFYKLSVLTIFTVLLFLLTGWVLWRTPFGLRLRSAGENPWAAESLGVKVNFYKYFAVTISGALAGLAGAYLAIVATGVYRGGQTAGRGFIGLATMIFGNWRPGGTALGATIFGYIDTLQLRDDANIHGLVLFGALLVFGIAILLFQLNKKRAGGLFIIFGGVLMIAYFGAGTFPPEVAQVAPYLTTLIVLATAAQRLRPPAADGIPYRKGESR